MAKKELTISEFREIIKEEALKLKKRIVLENEKKALQNELKSLMSESESLNEWGEHRKAEADFRATYKNEIDAIQAALKNKDASYIDLSKAMLSAVNKSTKDLAAKYGLSGPSDIGTLQKSLMAMVQPVDYNTFRRQVSSGTSLQDIIAGSSAGRQGWTSGS